MSQEVPLTACGRATAAVRERPARDIGVDGVDEEVFWSG
jgi:hypothetical protein